MAPTAIEEVAENLGRTLVVRRPRAVACQYLGHMGRKPTRAELEVLLERALIPTNSEGNVLHGDPDVAGVKILVS